MRTIDGRRFRGLGWVALGLAALTTGCAGTDFTRPAPETLVLGKTTYAEINARYGTPYRERSLLRNDQNVRQASYAYATAAGEPLVSGVTPARGMTFSFLDQVLVGHEFASSFRSDHTDFDATRVPQIKRGETTRAQVIALLGAPSGMWIYPMVRNREDQGLVWSYGQTRASGFSIRGHQKLLVVTVSPAGVVTEVELTASDEG